jgi:D-amino peptidase
MKVFMSCDMEGVAGIVDWSQCRPDGGAAYDTGCRLMLGEINAAIDGALAGGADDIVVNDAHGAMANLDPAALHGRAHYLAGRHKPAYMMQGLDETFDAVFLLGYHGSISGEPSVLSHTYNPEVISEVRLGGQPVGESGINALVAAASRVPIALLTGDAVTMAEAGPVAPDCETVITKQSVTRFSALSLHPEEACEAIAACARAAMGRVARDEVQLPPIGFPAQLDVECQTADMAEVASWLKGVERIGTRRVRIEADEGLAMYRAFVALTYITRQAGGR